MYIFENINGTSASKMKIIKSTKEIILLRPVLGLSSNDKEIS